ncbi:LysR family transcriptional regulator [Pseudonocardia asaccharolytica]|uniref:LysR family transcriptional regulator n=1 Tax=Pseudonocardia asaccharolytica TaxID=54010 RepID=UPI0003F82ED7|nr:LysR family transcriptional regulator [Pseudonocardia asaccharolytica]
MFDPVQLRSFLAVAQTLSFTRAAERLGVRQSTVSQHVRKLEAVADRPLFDRDTHSVALTPDGEAMLDFARNILDTTERALAHFSGSQVRGRLRFGVSEDLVLTRLPTILCEFRLRHPLVDVELTVGLSGTLQEALSRRELDLVFGKRAPGETHGTRVWRDRFVWVTGPDLPRLGPDEPVPLVAYPPPSISRAAAVTALEGAGRAWRISCTSGSLSGLRAAALAGLGVWAHAESLVPAGLVPAPSRARLPELGSFDFVLFTVGPVADGPAGALAATILAAGDRLHDVPADQPRR